MISDFDEHFAKLPIMAILRGIVPEKVEGVARVLLGEGISLIEIALNSPQALALPDLPPLRTTMRQSAPAQ